MFKWWKNLKIKWAKRELEKYAPKGEHLAYITKEEAKLLKKHGGAGLKVTATGIPSFFLDKIGDFIGGIGDKIGDIIGGIGDFIGGIGDFIGGVIGGIVDFASNLASGFLGMFGMSFDMPEYDSPSSFEVMQQGILVNKQSSVAGIPVVYGKRRIGGTRVFLDTYGDNNEYLVVCLALAEGEIEGVNRIYINDQEITLPNRSGSNSVYTKETVQAVGSTLANGEKSPFFVNKKPRAHFEIFHGTEDQQSSALLSGSSFWSPKHRLRGVAYIACRFEWVKAEFEKGEQTVFNPWQGVPTIHVEVLGKKILTAYSSSDNTDSNTSSYETQQANTGVGAFDYSDNPANCLLDYLRNPRYGKGLNDNRIDFGAFRTAKLTAEQSIQFSQDFTGTFMSCNAVINTEDTLMNNTKRLLQSCRGFLPYVDGKYRLKIETAEIPVDQFEITDDMIIGDIAIQSADKNAKYNECHLTYADEDKKYESNTFVYRDEDAAEQDGEPLILKTSLPTVTKIDRVKHIAKYMVDRSRKQLTVAIRTTNEGQSIVAGDLVRITHQYSRTVGGTDITDFLFKSPTGSAVDTVYSAPNMIFRVTATTLNYDGTVSMQLVEHDNFIYAVTVEAPEPTPPPIETPPPDPDPPGPTPEPPPQDPPKQCPEGQHYDYETNQCVPDNPAPPPEDPELPPEPTPEPPPRPEQKVRIATGVRYGYAGYIKFTIKPSRTTRNIINIDMTNANTGFRQIWTVVAASQTIVYEIASGSKNMSIRPGHVLEWKVYETDHNAQGMVLLEQGSNVVAGSATSNSVSSTNASAGGYA
tara:strand:+ start:15165 stop:17582 length:2418 start_codon:yes stop_codon:yes gene_type:complete